ncbi:MAG: glycine--tRNA ligase subunit beta, partial [Rhodospirillales bacterium]
KRLVTRGLKEAGLKFTRAEAFATPRRLALVVDGIPESTPDISKERKGPSTDAPDKAIQGFLGSVGLKSVDQCEKRQVKGREFYFAVIERKGQETAEVLAGIINAALAALPWPKSMRWAAHHVRWVRPLEGLLCLFGGKVIKAEFGPLKAVNATVGHRFLAPKPFKVRNFADYKTKLSHEMVILDSAERRRLIVEQADRLAGREGLEMKPDHGLLDEVAGLVEWPVVLIGSIDEEFMDLPAEVLSTVMRHHQKYFSLLTKDGKLAPRFIVVANTEARDGGKAIVAGNERVLRARLADAGFFWNQDLKRTLESRLEDLGELVFHASLGTVAAKAERVSKLASELAGYVGADGVLAARAGRLCKGDLTSGMVGEFPELQGVMGRHYALNDGEDGGVAAAINDHYSPLGPNDDCPGAPVSVALALADKIDTLTGFFGVGEKPTGSKDPLALRRAGLGVIRLIIENKLEMPLLNVFRAARGIYDESQGNVEFTAPAEEAAADLLGFLADRLKAHLKEKGVRHDLISAVFAVEAPGQGGEDDLGRLLARVEALKGFLDTEDGANLLVAYRRAANILRIEEKKDAMSYDGVADQSRFSQDEERALFEGLARAGEKSLPALQDERFADVMSALAELRGPVDAFFDEVTVNCDEPDVRANRLRLLSQIRSALGGVADFSKIEG